MNTTKNMTGLGLHGRVWNIGVINFDFTSTLHIPIESNPIQSNVMLPAQEILSARWADLYGSHKQNLDDSCIYQNDSWMH